MRYLIKTKDTEINTSEKRLLQWVAYFKKRKIEFVVISIEPNEKKPLIVMPNVKSMSHKGFYVVEFTKSGSLYPLKDIVCLCSDSVLSLSIRDYLRFLYSDKIIMVVEHS